jgi:DNA polymerase-3 subunit delta'
MGFEKILGQARPKEILKRALLHRRVPHAYLFTGPDGVGKEATAVEFAKALFCKGEGDIPCDTCESCRRAALFNHPDFFFIFPAPKSVTVENERLILDSMVQDPYARKRLWANPTIGIDRIRELRRTSTLKPLEGLRVVIIAEADKMTLESANALLKILEEPPASMHMILTTSRPNSLLPTIVSRCQEVRFGLLADELVEGALISNKRLTPEQAALVSRISQGSYRRALEWLTESLDEQRDYAVEFLRCCLRDNLSHYRFVEEMSKNHEKRALKELLNLLLIWFRDALMYSHAQDDDRLLKKSIVNVDKLETLRKFTGAFSDIDYDLAFRLLEKSIELIDRNVQTNLIFLVLITRLQGVFRKAS